MADAIDLTGIFRHQDAALAHNLRESQFTPLFSAVLSGSVRVNLSILGAMQFGAEKQTAIRLFAMDALSHIVVAARVGLWGALPESLSLLRGAIESCAQLGYVTSKQLYQAAMLEVNSKRFRKLEFSAACRELGPDGAAFARDHSDISNLASHSSSRRIRLGEYSIQGEAYDRLGFALDGENSELALGQCVELSQSVSTSLRVSYIQDDTPFLWNESLQKVFETHEALKKELKAKHQGSIPGSG